MGCGASSLTRVEDYVPADDVSAGCVIHVSDQHLDDADIASLVSEPSSAGEEATERPSLLKMKVAARVLQARMLHGINDDPNQFEDEWKTTEPVQNRRKQKAVTQFIDDHVQSIVRLELEEDLSCDSLSEITSSPGLSASTSAFSTVSGSQLSIPAVGEEDAIPMIHSEKARMPLQPASTHFHLPPATLRGHLDYDLLAMAAEREGTDSLPLGRFLKHKRRAIRKLSEVLAQRERCNPPLASQLRLAGAELPASVAASAIPSQQPTENLIYNLMDAFRFLHFSRSEGLHLHWVVSGSSHRQQEAHGLTAVIHRHTAFDDGTV